MRWLRLSRSGGQNRPVSCLEIGYELPVFRCGGGARGGRRLIGGPRGGGGRKGSKGGQQKVPPRGLVARRLRKTPRQKGTQKRFIRGSKGCQKEFKRRSGEVQKRFKKGFPRGLVVHRLRKTPTLRNWLCGRLRWLRRFRCLRRFRRERCRPHHAPPPDLKRPITN